MAVAACGEASTEPPEAAAVRPKVERSTGWKFTSIPAYERVDRAGLLAHLEQKLEGQPGRRLAALGRALKALGVLPQDYSLLDGLKKAYTEEILALYDIEERKIFLVREALEKPPKTREEKMLCQLGEAYIHGMNGIAEGVRLVRGSSVNQVPDLQHVLVTAGTAVPTSALILSHPS